MASVRVSRAYPSSVHEALTCWCDVGRWPEWVDGLARVVAVQGEWPQPGSSVIWESGPAGRGRVTEQVTDYVPLERLALFVEDSLMTGVQSVSFDPVPEAVEVMVRLEYSIKRRRPWTFIVESLFVRRPMTISLTKTLDRFGAVLEASRRSGLG